MKLPPRTTRTLALASLFALAPACAAANVLRVNAPRTQSSTATATKQQPANNKRDAKPRRGGDANARARRVREQAVAALVEAAEAVRPADDLYESVRLRAAVADVLWPHDALAARAMLRRAWEDANAPGAEERLAGFEDFEDPRAEARRALEDARRLVVKTAFKHDPRLAEELMRRFERDPAADAGATREADGVEATAPSSDGSGGGRQLSRAGWQRLLIAQHLLEEGDHAHAAATAAPLVAEGPTPMLIFFLAQLRARAPREADALYLRLLERTRADVAADANDVLLLSTPFVSPALQAQVGPDGSVSFSSMRADAANKDDASAAAVSSAATRRAFYDTAAAVLLRPRTAARGAAEAARLYFAVARLLPFFEREAPQHAPALHALAAALASELEAPRRDALSSQAGVASLTPKNPTDPLAPLMQSVADEPDAAERDRRRFSAVTAAAARRLWDRARGIASEIEDEETRRNARRVIAIEQVMNTLRAYEDDDARGRKKDAGGGDDVDDVERAAGFVRAADVPPEVRAAGFAQAAELAARTGRKESAEALLAEASSHAEQSERADSRRASAYALVALAAARAGSAQTWELLPALVRAVNEDEEFEFASLSFRYEFKHLGRGVEFRAVRGDPGSSDPGHVFAAAARLDLARTLAEARSLKDPVPRGNVLLAAARAALAREEERPEKPGAK